jgi:hypothetical protein
MRAANFSDLGIPFVYFTINRDTQWIFEAGKPVFLLKDHNLNRTYVMQAYARVNCTGCFQESYEVNQDFSDLYELGSRLDLPSGWEYVPSVVTETLMLPTSPNGVRADGNPFYPDGTPLATIVRDNVDNTYMLLTDSQGAPIDVSGALPIKKVPSPGMK